MTQKQKEAVKLAITLHSQQQISVEACFTLIEAITDKEVEVRYYPSVPTYPQVTYKDTFAPPFETTCTAQG